MPWLDSAIGWISPTAGLRRARARAAMQIVETQRRRYEGASAGRRTDGWLTSGGDANAEISSANARLRTRSRDLVRNNAYAAKAVQALTSNVIGGGIVPRADDRTDTLWARWSDRADASGLTDFYGLQSLIMRTVVELGSALVRLRIRQPDDALAVPFQLQVMEPDHLDGSKDMLVLPNGGLIHQGIQFDALGRRQGYWLYPRHPGSQGLPGSGTFESRFVPADEILHIFDPLRPGQANGVPWFAPAIIKLQDLDGYDAAELMRKKIEACFAAFVTSAEEDTPLGAATTDSEGNRIEEFEPGMVEYLRPGSDVKFGEPKATGGYGEYMRVQLHAVAAAVGLTYELLTGDLSQVNFSSARIGLIEFRRRVKQIQTQILLPQLLLPVWSWFVDIGQAAGALDMRRNRIGVKWTYPKFEAVEPLKDAMADLTRIRSGTLTLAEAQAAAGFDPADMLAEIAATNAQLDELKIILDSDPRKVSKAGGLQGKAAAQPAPPAEDMSEDEERALDRWLAQRFGISEQLLRAPNGHA